MALNNAVYQYQQNSIMTATPEELTLMLYNGCIKAIRFAKIAIEDKDYEKTNIYICKAEAIIRELRATLDMKSDISKNLYDLYTYFLDRLIAQLRDAWSQAMKDARIQQAGKMKIQEV